MNKLKHYNTVLIVGNGFDLNLKYPTSYSDFMKSKYFSDLVLSDNTLAKYLNHKMENNNNWIDIEKELATYSGIIGSEPSATLEMPHGFMTGKNAVDIMKSFKEEFIQLCNALKEYLNTIEKAEKFNYGFDKSHAYKLIKEISDEHQRVAVVNFNYTSFVEKLIVKICNNCTGFDIRQIHGSLKENIVFGVQDSMELKREHVFLYKSYNKCQNVRWIPQILENADKIVFFGYSLGETDHSYFDDFFKNQTIKNCRNKKIVFYHFGQDAYDDIIWQLKTLTNNRISYLKQYNEIQFKDSSNT